MSAKIGWCFVNIEGTAAYPKPERVSLGKDPSVTKRGHLSCPAVRAAAVGYMSVGSPFSLRLKFRRRDNTVSFIPVYPFTSINESKLSEIFRLEPREQWRSADVPLFQISSPYFFVADEQIEVEQCQPIFANSTSLNWRIIPGRFNIYGWQRPLNWAIEWDTKCGDLVIRLGEPLYYLKFFDAEGRLISNPNIQQVELTEDLRAKLNASAGVTSLQRGTAALMRAASDERTGPLLKPISK